MYGEKAKQLIFDLPNRGRIPNPTCFSKAANPVCGDEIEVFLVVEDHQIKEFGYLVSGCAGSVAAAAGLSELVQNCSVSEALLLDEQALFDFLGGVPSAKRHGLTLAIEALQSALEKT